MKNITVIDEQKRIALPDELCKFLGIYTGDEFQIITDETHIILTRHTPTCLACNDDTDVHQFNKTFLCGECRDTIAQTL